MGGLWGDMYFWIGLALFASSIWSAFWILKSLHREPDDPSLPRDLNREKNTGMARPTAATLETLSEKLNRVEEILMTIEQKLGDPAKAQIGELTAEVHSLLQFLKSNPSASNNQVSQLSSKVDKIYQVISSLSGTEGKP